MRKLLREAINLIKEAGGTNVQVVHGGRHTVIHYHGPKGPSRITMHLGSDVGRFAQGRIKNQIRQSGLRIP